MALTQSQMIALGTQAPDFDLPATDGKHYTLADFTAARALLVVFTCNHCPYAQAIEDRLLAIARDYASDGLQVVLINSNDAATYPDDSFESMKRRASQKHYPCPYLHDETQAVAKAYQAACTPDPYLFDAGRKLAYRGRVDDNWQEPGKVTRKDLRAAIEAVLSNTKPSPEQVPSLGCNIKWKD